MSVVFERQLNNIKEGLQAINQMKVSMESLKGSDSNLMREGILQIQEANQKLSITQQTLSIIKNKAKNSIVFTQGIKSVKTLITQLKVLKALLGDLYTKTKAIVFAEPSDVALSLIDLKDMPSLLLNFLTIITS